MASLRWESLIFLLALVMICSRTRAQGDAKPAWSYEGSTGPEYWADIVPAASLCRSGTLQSPINIETATITRRYLSDLVFNYSTASYGFLNNTGATVAYRMENVNTLSGGPMLMDLSYLTDVEHHVPSEHTVDGKRFAMELQFVHTQRTSTPQLTIVSILVEEGQRSPFLEQYFTTLQKVPKQQDTALVYNINLAVAIPSNTSFMHYKGSKTTPNCDEAVNWIIFNQPITASREQIQSFTNIYSKNSRPIKLRQQRIVYQHLMGVVPCQIAHPARKEGFPWELLSVFVVVFFGIFLLRTIMNSSADPFMSQ